MSNYSRNWPVNARAADGGAATGNDSAVLAKYSSRTPAAKSLMHQESPTVLASPQWDPRP